MCVSLKGAGLAALVRFGPKSHDTSSMDECDAYCNDKLDEEWDWCRGGGEYWELILVTQGQQPPGQGVGQLTHLIDRHAGEGNRSDCRQAGDLHYTVGHGVAAHSGRDEARSRTIPAAGS